MSAVTLLFLCAGASASFRLNVWGFALCALTADFLFCIGMLLFGETFDQTFRMFVTMAVALQCGYALGLAAQGVVERARARG